MSMGGDNLVGLRFIGRFFTGAIFQIHQKVVIKVIVCMCIPILGRVRKI